MKSLVTQKMVCLSWKGERAQSRSASGWQYVGSYRMQERYHKTRPGDLKSVFIKAGDSETKKGPGVEALGESIGGAGLWLPRNVLGSDPRQGSFSSLKSQKERGLGDRFGG